MLMSVTPAAHAVPVGDTPLRVSCETDFDFAGEPYRDLLRRADATAFEMPGWQAPLHAMLAVAAGAERCTVVVRDGLSGGLILVLPLVRRRLYGLAVVEMADFAVTDYHAPVVDEAELPRLLADRSLAAGIEGLLAPCDLLSITKTVGHEALLSHILPRARRGVMRISTHGAELSDTWTQWREAHVASRVRRYLDKKRRSFRRQGSVAFRLAVEPSEIDAAFEALRGFRRRRFAALAAVDVMADPDVYGFYRHVALEGARSGEARTYVLSLDGAPVGVVFGIVRGAAFLHLLLGYDVERHARRSLGLLASEDAVRAALESGLAYFDFTVGDYPFKAELGASPRPLYEWHQAGSMRGWLAMVLIVGVREAKRWLKPIVRPHEHPPYSPMAGTRK